MVLGWASVGVVYNLADRLQGPGIILPETTLDKLIPFNPVGIWLYLSFFLLVPLTYCIVDIHRLRWLTISMQICAVVCGMIFVLWPTTLIYPEVPGNGVSEALLRWLISGDSRQNCLPSLHGALTLLCVWALLDSRHRLRSFLAVLVGLCICYAIIQLRRHISIDLGAGLLTGLACGYLAQWQRSPVVIRRVPTP